MRALTRRQLQIENRQLRADLAEALELRHDLEQELTETTEDLGERQLLLEEQERVVAELRATVDRLEAQAAGR